MGFHPFNVFIIFRVGKDHVAIKNPGGIKNHQVFFLHAFNKPPRKLRSKKTPMFAGENQKIHEGWSFRQLPPWNEQRGLHLQMRRKPQKEGSRIVFQLINFHGVLKLREGYENQENPQNQNKKKNMGYPPVI